MIECEECGEVKAFCAKRETYSFKCNCGHITPLENLRPLFMHCKCGEDFRYVVVKNGFEVIAAVMPLNIVSQEYLEKLAEFEVHCTQQFAREKARIDFIVAKAAEQEAEEEAEQIAMEGTQDGQNEN